jgi:PAS domain-containing protein
VSKASVALSKWLILRGRQQSDASVDVREAGGHSGPSLQPKASRPRSPSGDAGLPCDWLFSLAVEPVIIVDVRTNCIVQANPAAAQLLRRPHSRLVGESFAGVFDPSSSLPLKRSMETALVAGVADEGIFRLPGDATELRARLTLFRADSDSYLLVRLAAGVSDELEPGPATAPRDRAQSPVFDAIDGASVGFLLTDSGLRIEYANQAFTRMIGLPSAGQALGRSVVGWLELSEVDLARLRDQMLQREATSLMTACLRSESRSSIEVEICAVAVPDGPHTCWGFTVRELPRLN